MNGDSGWNGGGTFVCANVRAQPSDTRIATLVGWRWRWQGTDLEAARGFWAIGEAVVDAVIGRFPKTFSTDLGSEGLTKNAVS